MPRGYLCIYIQPSSQQSIVSGSILAISKFSFALCWISASLCLQKLQWLRQVVHRVSMFLCQFWRAKITFMSLHDMFLQQICISSTQKSQEYLIGFAGGFISLCPVHCSSLGPFPYGVPVGESGVILVLDALHLLRSRWVSVSLSLFLSLTLPPDSMINPSVYLVIL